MPVLMQARSRSTPNSTNSAFTRLELTEIIFDIEDEFDIQVDMNTSDAWDKLRNVGDLVEAVRGPRRPEGVTLASGRPAYRHNRSRRHMRARAGCAPRSGRP
jgi:hypothetical protein